MRGRCTAILKARHYTHKCTLHSLRSGDKAHKHFTFGPVHSVWGKFARNFLAFTGNFGKTFYTLLYLKSENAIFLSQLHHIPGKINTLSFSGIHSAQMALPLITWIHTLVEAPKHFRGLSMNIRWTTYFSTAWDVRIQKRFGGTAEHMYMTS